MDRFKEPEGPRKECLFMDNDLQKFIDANPKLKSIINQEAQLFELENDIDGESSIDEKINLLQIYRGKTKRYIERIMNFYIKELQSNNESHQALFEKSIQALDTYKEQVEQLNDALQKESDEHFEFYDNLCLAFLIEPRETFEAILQHVERKKKIKCQDGLDNWQWSLNFHFLARVRMAFRIVFSGRTA